MTHLRRYLEEHGVLYPEQLAEATRRQQIYGGSLDTILLELELIDPVTLGELLENACGFPVAPPHLLDNGLDRPWSEIPEDLQRSRWVEPLGKEGDEVVVAVHPDLPDDLLGRLLRNLRRMRPMVVPECCMEKVAAERHGSVVPQRYAILAASYLSAVRRRPSVSGVYEVPREEEPAPPSAPSRVPSFTPPGVPEAEPRPRATPSDEPPADRRSVSGMIDVVEAVPADIPLGPSEPRTGDTEVATGPPVTRRGTLVATGAPPAAQGPGSIPAAEAEGTPEPEATEQPEPSIVDVTQVAPAPEPADVTQVAPAPEPVDVAQVAPTPEPHHESQAAPAEPEAAEALEPTPPPQAPPRARDEADVRRRLEQARAALEATRSRDEALDAILAAAMVLSSRSGLFRVRGSELVGLTSPHSDLEDVGGKIVAAPDGSAAAIALHDGVYVGLVAESDLRLATGIDATTPVALQRVAVRGRPVVVVYLDRDGEPVEDLDREWLADIALAGGHAFEEILKLRRRAGPSSTTPKTTPPAATEARLGGVPPERSWSPSERIRVAYGGGPSGAEEPAPVEPTSSSRMSTPEQEGTEGLPPSPVVPTPPPSEPENWRLTPELAARAMEESAGPEPAPPATPAVPSAPDDTGDYQEPPASLQDEDLPIRTRMAAEDSAPTPAPQEHEDDETSFAGVADEDDETSFAGVADEDDETSFAGVADEDDETSFAGVSEAASFEEPPATLQVELLPVRPRTEDIKEIDQSRAEAPSQDAGDEEDDDVVHIPSHRPTMELGSRTGNRPPSEPRPAATAPAPDGEPAPEPSASDSMSRLTMHSTPPPPSTPPPDPGLAPLPPPPPSAVDETDETGARRPRSATISGLPPPELKSRAGAKKRIASTVADSLPRGDEEVDIIPLAQPITPATARGRIELEDEDWMPSGAPLAEDERHEEIDALIESILSGARDPSALQSYGNAGLLRLVARFPGPLEILRRDLRSLPPPSAHGPLIRAVIAMGPAIVPHLIDLLEHPNPDVRFYAAFVFHELRDVRCMRPLGKLAFDGNGDVRVVSMRVLETYRRHEGFDAAASIVREQLEAESRNQQLHAARAAGTLRDIGSVPALIELLSSGDRFIQEASLESLCSITGQQHGLKPHRWRAWYQDNQDMHRVEWIIDSLRHRDLPVRRWAADELVRITGHRVPFSPMGDKKAREVAAKAWTDWWNERGRDMFGI